MINQEYSINIEHYSVALIFANKMLDSGIITANDLAKIEEKLAEKYGIKTNSLYRANDLIDLNSRGNITD